MKKRILSLGFFLLFLSSWSHALTLSDIRTEIRTRIKDTDSLRRRYSDTQLNNLINQTQRDIVNISWIIKKSTDIELVAGTTYYSVPTDLIAIHRVTLRFKDLPESSLQELDSRFNGGTWQLSSGLPDTYFQDPARSDKFGVYPWPSNSSSTGTIRMIYMSQGTDLSADADEPFNAEDRYTPYHDLLIYEPCQKIFLIEGEAAKAQEYRAYYEARIQILLSVANNKTNWIPGFSSQRK